MIKNNRRIVLVTTLLQRVTKMSIREKMKLWPMNYRNHQDYSKNKGEGEIIS
jgi:hypothetical protein